jgi:hypothetical protein
VRVQLSMVSRLKNEYFLQLMGYYLDDSHRILVYQFASNGSLHDTLHGTVSYRAFIIITSRCCDHDGSQMSGTRDRRNLTKGKKTNRLQARRA